MKNIVLQIREEVKTFSRSDLYSVIGISKEEYLQWVKKGKLPKPLTNNLYSKDVALNILNSLNIDPLIKLRGNSRKRWQEVLDSELIMESGGIFVVSQDAVDSHPKFTEMIKDYGLWDAQGLNNHEHLNEYIENPIAQTFLAEELICSYKKKLCKIDTHEKFVLYWNGSRNSTICIYFNSLKSDDAINAFDHHLKMRKTIVSEIRINDNIS